MSFAIAGTVLTVGATAYASRQAGKSADAQIGAARDATGESARQFDLTRADTASGRSLYEGANAILGRTFGIPITTSDQFTAQQDQLVGDTMLPPGVTFKDKGGGWYEAYYGDQYAGYLRPGGQNGRFVPADGFDPNTIRQQRVQQSQASAPAGPSMQDFFASPSYNFRRTEGTRGIERSAAARGGAASGNALRALNEFNSNLASGEYGNWLDSVFRAAGLGSNAVNTSVAAGENHADRAGRNALLAGDARASGIENRANLIGQGVNSLAGGLGYLWRGNQGNQLQEIPMYSLPRRI